MTHQQHVRTLGGPEPCDFCGAESSPPDVQRGRPSGAMRVMHPDCAEQEAVATIIDAAKARRLQRDGARRRLRRVV